MKNILILGANGEIARFAIPLFLERADFRLKLYARNTKRLGDLKLPEDRAEFIEGDVLDAVKLGDAMLGVDLVYANLSGDLVKQATNIINTMKLNKVKRLIFISSMGIYDEVPTQKYKSVLNPYRDSALLIEASDLEYTIIRPEWLNNKDEIDYEITRKGDEFKNPEKWLSRKSVADLVFKCASEENYEVRQSLGVNKP